LVVRDLRNQVGLKAWRVMTMHWRDLADRNERMLKSRKAVPSRLLESGFAFAFPTWETAGRGLCRAR
jgi:NAD dependent epimerase/dehydratase family enzyme